MNKCKVCDAPTKNKHYCNMKCRDISRKITCTEVRLCETCGCEMNIRKKSKQRFCSVKCSSISAIGNKDIARKVKATKKKRYGDENYVNVEKIKETTRLNYGVDHYSKTDEFKQKFTDTMIQRYGVPYAQQSKSIRQKTKDTVNDRYGGFTFQSDELRSKVVTTNLERYGHRAATKNEDVIQKTKETNLKRYGTTSPLQNDDIIIKSKTTLLEKFGVDNISKHVDNKSKIKNCIRYKFICDIFDGDRLKDTCIPLFEKSDYIDSKGENKYPFKCNSCDNEFVDVLFAGHLPRCNICYPSESSLPEKEVFEFIQTLSTNVIRNVRTPLDNKMEIDVFDPQLKLGVEYHGLYWHSEISGGKDKQYHLSKRDMCIEKNITLIQVFENEWFDKTEIVKSILRNRFSSCDNIVYARKCIIKEIPVSICSAFLNANHIQGSDRSSTRIGLFMDGKLVSVMTFCKSRFDKKVQYEMSRYCNILNTRIVGGASKLFKYFVKHNDPISIVSYSDMRYFNGGVYLNLGFEFVGNTPPSYHYITNSQILNRVNFQKHKLKDKLENFDPTLTEWQNMQLNGYDRIWDCGNLKFIWESPTV